MVGDKILREEQRDRSIQREKKNRAIESKYRNISPPPKKIGNPKGSKGFCSHCNPALSARLDKKQNVADAIKEAMQNLEDIKNPVGRYEDEITSFCSCGAPLH